jgi:hypothetical protein
MRKISADQCSKRQKTESRRGIQALSDSAMRRLSVETWECHCRPNSPSRRAVDHHLNQHLISSNGEKKLSEFVRMYAGQDKLEVEQPSLDLRRRRILDNLYQFFQEKKEEGSCKCLCISDLLVGWAACGLEGWLSELVGQSAFVVQ